MAKKEPFYKGVNFKQFTNKDGYLKGGVEVKVPEEIPTKNKVGGQRRMRPEKKSDVNLKEIHDKYFDKSGMKHKGYDIIREGLKGLKK